MRSSSAPCPHGSTSLAGAVLLLIGLLSFGLLATTTHAQTPPAGISRDDAVSIVTRTQFGGSLEGIRLFVNPEPLSAGTTIATWRRDAFTAPSAGWFVFVDRHPAANWEHACSYFFVDGATGTVERFDAMTPPVLRSQMTEITNGRDNPDPGASEAALERFSARLRELPKPPAAQDRGQAYAFIISGGADAGNNHIRYWNDCSFIYRALVEYYGYADDHIRVCISDGTNPAADRSNGTNSPPDLDGDGDPDIEYPATMQYIGQVFGELAATLTPADQLFIFTTDHGGQESGQDCYLNLWNWEELRDDQMAAFIATIPCASIICTFEQCFSGGMVDDLAADGRVIATAANWNEYSWAMGPDYIWDTFVYFWTSAVAWERPDGTPVDADTNNDGIVSMREAFVFAEANDFEDETPQYSSVPPALGDMLNLYGNMDGVYLMVDALNIDDDNLGASSGDGDGIADFAETIELRVALHNMGQSDAFNVAAALTSTSPYVTILQGSSLFEHVPSGGTALNAPPLVLRLACDIPHGEPLGLVLGISESPGTLPLTLAATAPSYAIRVVEVNDIAGDQNGLADPGEYVSLKLRFENQGGCPTPLLTAVLDDGGYFDSDDRPHLVGVIPNGQSVEVNGVYLWISPDCPPVYSGTLVLDMTAPGGYEKVSNVLLCVGPWSDAAENEQGWAFGAAGDGATSGIWTRVDPNGTNYGTPPQQVQPETDHTPDPGHMCFVTGNGSVGGAAGENDVDGGKTTLLSPEFNVERASSATLSYWRWYTNNLGNNPASDYWDVDVTADGTNWVHLEHTIESANSWTEKTFDIGNFVPLNGTIRFRFVADDVAPGSLVEAALDDITVTIIGAPSADVAQNGSSVLTSGLGICRPNPLAPGIPMTLNYRLSARGPVRLDLYDVSGRHVRALFHGAADAGEHRLRFEPIDGSGRPISSGVYFIRMETPGLTEMRQVTIVR